MINPLQILHEYWGYSSFKPMQEDIINNVLNGKDTVALLPTGGGKSVCFQIPALAMEGICIVVSPLIALINDQVNSLQNKGIKALAIVGGHTPKEIMVLLDNAMYGNYKFLYISPERLRQELVQNAIRKMNVNLIAIDEAHCISKWGKDFRPAYMQVNVLNELHPMVPKIALTATATQEVLTDTIAELKLELPDIFRSSFIRDNLSYQVLKEDDKLYRIEQLLKKNKESAIIYVRSRKMTVEVANQLNHLNIKSTFYHGGVEPEEKKIRLNSWLNGTIPVMVATNAFGMGIDHPKVRFVIHIQLPESLESYFQEAGRAGRDGNHAYAYILYNEYDKVLIQKQFIDSQPNVSELKTIYRTLNNYFQISYGEGEFTEHSFDYNQFCKTYKFNSIKVYNGLNTLDRLGIIQLSKQFGRKSVVKFLIPSEKIISYFENDVLCSIIGKTILRLYGGIFEIPTPLNLDLIASKTNQSISTIITQLKKMERDQVIDLKLHITDATITFLVPREDEKTIHSISKEVNALLQKKELEVGSVLTYLENDKVCKSVQLVNYFGENNAAPCGICSVCNNQKTTSSKKEAKLISKEILILLEDTEMSSREITERLIFTEEKILFVLQQLQDIQKIKINSKNQYYIV